MPPPPGRPSATSSPGSRQSAARSASATAVAEREPARARCRRRRGPRPGTCVRSTIAETLHGAPAAVARSRSTGPSPPRAAPAPPESVRSSRRCCTSGVSVSITSAGTPATPLGKPVVLRPSLVGARARAAALEEREGEQVVAARPLPRQTVSQIESAPPAISLPGIALASAPKMMPGQQVADEVARGDRSRLLRSSGSSPAARVDVHRPERALVVRHLGADRRLDGERRRRRGCS